MVQVDFGSESLLGKLKNPMSARFRVSDYDPRRTEECHANGRHIYLVHREIMGADVVFNLPKLKTHEKVGITCGLKGFVGTIAQKDCLAHHRFGSPAENGDEFPSHSAMRTIFSKLHDHVNMRFGNSPTTDLLRVIDRNARRLIRIKGGVTFGGWYGNDTAWRMTLDIARLLLYANSKGVMCNNRQRKHLVMVDGIVGGEKEGPLSPSPFDSGLLLFSDDVALGDWASCMAMGFDPLKIPLVREAFRVRPFPVSESHPGSCRVYLNGRYRHIEDLEQVLDRSFVPPRGWKGHAERDARASGAGHVTL
jgi:hypothetical protein